MIDARVSLFPRVDRKRDPHARDLHVVPHVGLEDLLDAADLALVHDADLEHRVGVEVAVLDVAVLHEDANLVSGRAVDLLGAEVIDAVAFRAPVDERALDVRIVRERFGFVCRALERVAPSLPGLGAPHLFAVVRVDAGEPLEGRLDADAARPLLHEPEARLDVEVVLAEALGSRETNRLERADLVEPSACGDVARDELVDLRGGFGRRRGVSGADAAARGDNVGIRG